MTTLAWEAQLNQAQPVRQAGPIYKATATTITFSVLDENRSAVNIAGYAAKFVAQDLDTETELFNKACSIVGAPLDGKFKVTLLASDLASSKEVLAELNLWSSGDTNNDITDRVQYQFPIQKVIDSGS